MAGAPEGVEDSPGAWLGQGLDISEKERAWKCEAELEVWGHVAGAEPPQPGPLGNPALPQHQAWTCRWERGDLALEGDHPVQNGGLHVW